MAKKLKKGAWSPAETSLLMGVKKDPNTPTNLKKIVKLTGRAYTTVYAKWNTMRKQESSGTVAIGDDVPPMELKFEPDYTGKSTNVDEKESASFIKGLEIGITKLKPMRGGIVIPARYERVARKYLSTNTLHHFGVSTVAGNSKFKRVIMKY